MLLKDLLQSEKNINNIRIKVIVNRKENIIVGDTSMVAIFSTTNSSYENMVEGDYYMILKPLRQDVHTFTANEKLKPVKIAEFALSPKKGDVNKLKEMIQATPTKNKESPANSPVITNFKDILVLSSKSEIKSVPVKIVNISKVIAGTYGPYNIAKIKDSNGDKLDLNMYKTDLRNKLQRGNVVELTKLKLTEYSKDGETVKRLSTTARSSAHKCNSFTETLFEKIPLGDERQEGTVIAVNDIFPYISCSKCWKKTEVDDIICQCGNKDNINVIDFHCQFYIQIKKEDEEEVKVVQTFRRTTNLTFKIFDVQDIQKILEEKYVEKFFTFEWNKNTDDEELKMVMIAE